MCQWGKIRDGEAVIMEKTKMASCIWTGAVAGVKDARNKRRPVCLTNVFRAKKVHKILYGSVELVQNACEIQQSSESRYPKRKYYPSKPFTYLRRSRPYWDISMRQFR